MVEYKLLYDSVTKKRFFIKGVTYDPTPLCEQWDTDVLADDYSHSWLQYEADLQDILLLNVNTIRIYQLDPLKTHTKFMQLAESLGLYVIAPLTSVHSGYLDAGLPSPDCYTAEIDGYGNVGTNLHGPEGHPRGRRYEEPKGDSRIPGGGEARRPALSFKWAKKKRKKKKKEKHTHIDGIEPRTSGLVTTTRSTRLSG